jgi:hypothetical protein
VRIFWKIFPGGEGVPFLFTEGTPVPLKMGFLFRKETQIETGLVGGFL